MSAEKQLVKAIQKMCEGSELFKEVRGILKDLRARGVLPAVTVTALPEDDTSCCAENNGVVDPGDGSGGGRNPDGSWSPPGSDPDTKWNDCETGQPITFDPAGFPQPESCKGDPVCEYEDPTYSPGTYWQTNGSPVSISKSAIQAAKMDHDKFYSEGSGYFYGIRGGPDSYVMLRYVYAFGGYVGNTTTVVNRYTCGDNPTGIFAEVCSGGFDPSCVEYTENGDIRPSDPASPPMWESDSTTNYTIANGCIVASSCDPDASEQSQQCNECINMCDSAGNQWTVCGTGDGGFVAYDPSGGKDGAKYDYNGNPQSTIPAGSGRGIF